MLWLEKIFCIITDHAWMICRLLFLAYLCVLTVMDIRRQQLSLLLLLSGFLFAVAGMLCGRDIHPLLLAAGGGVGIVFLMASRVTDESFGYGDSLLIVIMGSFLGFWNILSVLTAAFLLAAVFSAVMLITRKFNRKSAFPFVPFLTLAYVGGMLFGVY